MTFYGLPTGAVIMPEGMPGAGKSHFAGSVCDVIDPDKVLLWATKAREISSASYMRHGLTQRAELFLDDEWDPTFDEWDAKAYTQIRSRLKDVKGDPDVHGIIIDPGTEVGLYLAYMMFKNMRVADDVEMRKKDSDSSFAFFQSYADKMAKFMALLQSVAHDPRAPKIIMIPWHVQPLKEGTPGKASPDDKGRGVAFEGKVLPKVRGQYRQTLAADADIVVRSMYHPPLPPGSKAVPGRPEGYKIQVKPDRDFHAKVAMIPEPKELWIDNEFSKLHELILEGLK